MCQECGCGGPTADPATVAVFENILAENDRTAARLRERLDRHRVFVVNLMSSPGSGKTRLLEATFAALPPNLRVAVIEGDLETENDAARIRRHGITAIQITTGVACHLDAAMTESAFDRLALDDLDLVFVENVGNLVCPAAFDLGEAHKVAILSVTEGEDKPLKYPDMFRAATLMLINKIDLLPYVAFDVERAVAHARRVNPALQVIRVSATSGEGFGEWTAWLENGLAAQRARKQETVAALRRRIAELEAQLAGAAR